MNTEGNPVRRLFIWGVLFNILSSLLFARVVTCFEGRVFSIDTSPNHIISLTPLQHGFSLKGKTND